MSSHNPFRDPPASQPVASSSSSAAAAFTPHSEPTGSGKAPAPTASTDVDASSSRVPTPPAVESDPTGLTDDLPPAYTPGPSTYQGETTVEYGPARPFQPPPRPPPQPQHIQPQSTGWSTLQNQYSGGRSQPSLLQQITGHLVDHIANSGNNYNRYNASQGYNGYPGQSMQPQYTGQPQQNGNGPPLPPRPSTTSGYAPPPGPPPTSPPSQAGHQNPPAETNDGRPTQKPVPGHPLLNAGRLLVYPAGYECYKCHNIGYKQNDPSHPCRKCWQKYAKPFTGALAYSSFEQGAPGRNTLQRPLPVLPPPPQFRAAPPRPPWQPQAPLVSGFNRAPPPNSVVYRPGDPRIGGRLCWRCDGRGLVSLLFLEDDCPVCGGIGRLFQ